MKLAPAQVAGAEARSGRGDRFRTRDLRIWSPLLYQLSYSPIQLPGNPCRAREGRPSGLLGLAMNLVSTAGAAVFFELQLCRIGLLVLGSRVILAFTLGTLEMNDVAHGVNPYSMTSSTRPEPTVRPPSRMANLRPFSIAMGWISSTVRVTLSPGMTISRPASRMILPVTSVVRK